MSCGGTCTNTDVDSDNCGGCGNACAAGQVCSGGTCAATCGAPFAKCGAGCADTRSDPDNCGGCGVACPAGQLCVGGACSVTCGAQTKCGSGDAAYCANLETDNANCGSCGTTCPSGQVCSGGTCAATCGAPFVQCGQSCADTDTDPDNCGGCGVKCGPYEHAAAACVKGQCREICDAGCLDCSGTETAGCTVDSQTDPDNCNGCGMKCGPYDKAVGQCVSGACGLVCATGFLDCDGVLGNGCEVGSATSTNNCGACGHVCSTGCVNGGCRKVTSIGAGRTHTCAVSSDGLAYCWGEDDFDQLDSAAIPVSSFRWLSPVVATGLSGATAIDGGDGFTCALVAGGLVQCWGSNDQGQLGTGLTSLLGQRVPGVPVEGLSGATAISLGKGHACALLAGGAVDCWGRNNAGQVGNTSGTRVPSPHRVSGVSDAIQIAAGAQHTCALLSGGTVECWGLNTKGQLGNGSTLIYEENPVFVSGLSGATWIATGGDHTCAVLADGSVACWGSNDRGQLGACSLATPMRRTPVVVPLLSGAKSLALGLRDSCALLESGSVMCWGQNDGGQLGDGDTTDQYAPTAVPSLGGVTELVLGQGHTCALLSDASMDCWGMNNYGEVGDGTTTNRSSPVVVRWP